MRAAPAVASTTISKKCTRCGIEKTADQFNKRYGRPNGPHLISMCKTCHTIVIKLNRHKRKAQDPESHAAGLWKGNLKGKFGMTVEEYERINNEQKGLCAICGLLETAATTGRKFPNRLAVDHNHRTGKNRGLLCSKCNMAIGLVHESEDILTRMIHYLKENK